MSVNKVILVGNVGGDPEIRSTADGREIANFSLATTESWKDRNTGEKQSKTEWHKIVIFSQGLVGIVKNYVKKGSQLYIEGQLQTRKWTDNQGIDKYTTEVVLQNFNSALQMLGSRNSSDNNNRGEFVDSNTQFAGSQGNIAKNESFDEELDDDIPF